MFLLPDSPRYYVKRGKIDKARDTLVRLRGQPPTSHYIELELAEIVANAEYEARVIPTTGWYSSYAACFTGSLRDPGSNLRRTILGTSLQMMQQWTGVNFVFYFSFVAIPILGSSRLNQELTSPNSQYSLPAIDRRGQERLHD